MPLKDFGPAIQDWCRLSWPEPRVYPHHIDGEVVHVDHYGNALTNITSQELGVRPNLGLVHVAGIDIPIRATYAAVGSGEPVAVLSSNLMLEVAVNHGNAAREFGLSRGSRISIREA
jgi:hypothetical protein